MDIISHSHQRRLASHSDQKNSAMAGQRIQLGYVDTSFIKNSTIPQQAQQIPPPQLSREYIEQRRQSLMVQFHQIDKNNDGFIDFEELYQHLYRRNQTANRQYVQPIFESLDFNNDGKISLDQFVDAYNEEMLKYQNQISRLRQEVTRKQERLKEIQDQISVQEQEQKNNINSPFGSPLRTTYGNTISAIGRPGSLKLSIKALGSLNVIIEQGQTLPSDCYVTITCEEQEISTQSSNTLQWRSEFTFRVLNNLNSIIQFKVLRSSDDQVIGHLAIPLKSLSGQKLQENWYHLKKPGTIDKLSQARLYIKMQWIRSKLKLIKDAKVTMLADLHQCEKQLQNLEVEYLKMGGKLEG